MGNIASQIPKSTPSEVDVKMHVYHTSGMTIGWHTQVYCSPRSTPKGGLEMFMIFETARLLNGPTNAYTIFRVLLGFASLYR